MTTLADLDLAQGVDFATPVNLVDKAAELHGIWAEANEVERPRSVPLRSSIPLTPDLLNGLEDFGFSHDRTVMDDLRSGSKVAILDIFPSADPHGGWRFRSQPHREEDMHWSVELVVWLEVSVPQGGVMLSLGVWCRGWPLQGQRRVHRRLFRAFMQLRPAPMLEIVQRLDATPANSLLVSWKDMGLPGLLESRQLWEIFRDRRKFLRELGWANSYYKRDQAVFCPHPRPHIWVKVKYIGMQPKYFDRFYTRNAQVKILELWQSQLEKYLTDRD